MIHEQRCYLRRPHIERAQIGGAAPISVVQRTIQVVNPQMSYVSMCQVSASCTGTEEIVAAKVHGAQNG